MERVKQICICVVVALTGFTALAQQENSATPKAQADEVVPDATPAVKAPVKKRIRSGSFLVGNRGISPATDTRGDFERRRDLEIIKHYTRRAQLDVIARRAKQVGQTELLERLDRIRRIEDERHRLRMQEVTEGSVFLDMRGLP